MMAKIKGEELLAVVTFFSIPLIIGIGIGITIALVLM